MGLKIAVASAVSWPYVRRGSRVAYELAVSLARKGHDVHYISTKPGSVSRKRVHEGIIMEYHRIIVSPLLSVLKLQSFDTFTLPCFFALIRNGFDIVQTIFPMDAFAASLNKSIKGTPFVHYMIDCFNRPYYITKYGKWMFYRSMKNISRVVVMSSFVREDVKKKFGIEADVIPGGVDISQFTPKNEKNLNHPKILCTSSPLIPRKRVELLVKAFEQFHRHLPNAVLQVSGHSDKSTNKRLMQSVSPETRKSIEMLGIGKKEELPGLYRQAAVTVVPSVDEAFGLVILESLASGTPVVGTRSGGIPDILNNPRTGVLFGSTDGPDGLCKAILKGLDLAHDLETSKRCRQHAEQYKWDSIAGKFEQIYMKIISNVKRFSSC